MPAAWLTTAAGEGQPQPIATPVTGTVLANGKPLVAESESPIGATVDATNGTVTLESVSPTGTLQRANFAGATFKLGQPGERHTHADPQRRHFGGPLDARHQDGSAGVPRASRPSCAASGGTATATSPRPVATPPQPCAARSGRPRTAATARGSSSNRTPSRSWTSSTTRTITRRSARATFCQAVTAGGKPMHCRDPVEIGEGGPKTSEGRRADEMSDLGRGGGEAAWRESSVSDRLDDGSGALGRCRGRDLKKAGPRLPSPRRPPLPRSGDRDGSRPRRGRRSRACRGSRAGIAGTSHDRFAARRRLPAIDRLDNGGESEQARPRTPEATTAAKGASSILSRSPIRAGTAATATAGSFSTDAWPG